ncbi:MAG: hypothetical protein JNG88_01425 [Phycisphaerales bacterium]|nr:hypothetical protein [Phycisphaerales bacterium]
METPPTTSTPVRPAFAAIAVAVAAGAAICTILSILPRAGLILVTDGAYTIAVLAACAGYGHFPARALLQHSQDRAKQCALSLALGIGIVSILTLQAGIAGWLSSLTAWLITAIGIALGVAGLVRRGSSDSVAPAPTTPDSTIRASEPGAIAIWASLIGVAAVGVSIGLSLSGATLPPGLLWSEEAGGYDALEYHLQAPHEYNEAGRIRFLPHNVYASFPQIAEMHYLLLMHLAGGPINGAIPAQLLHAYIGIIAIVACTAFVPRGAPRLMAILVAASVQWIAYLGCLAYVENFLLLLSVAAGGVLLDAVRHGELTTRSVIAAGLCAGLAAGCKYTALALVAAALAMSLLIVARQPLTARFRLALAFTLSASAAFAPWMARNYAFTGNPLFPFFYDQLGGKSWSADQNEQWKRGHRLSPTDIRLGRTRVALRELIGPNNTPLLLFANSRFGVMALLLALFGAAAAHKQRETWFLLVWIALILSTWLAVTHMPGRFVVVLAAPLAWLSTSIVRQSPRLKCVALGLACVGAGIAAARLAFDLNSHLLRFEKRTRVSAALMPGQTAAFRDAHALAALPADSYVWIIGDAAAFYVPRRCHYTVVFNRDPWLESCIAEGAMTGIDKLRRQGVTHVYISWSEVARLRATYGFSEAVTPEWVASLVHAGLRRVHAQNSASGELISELFELPRP